MNIGTWMPMGMLATCSNELDFHPHELFDEYERWECDYFRGGQDMAEGLWRFPAGTFWHTTWFEEISRLRPQKKTSRIFPSRPSWPFPVDENGQCVGRRIMLEWVMDQV